tara:strand:- start:8121 stop:9170 length:1050 start_codon:yes stop_codon:yes gene_type:complete
MSALIEYKLLESPTRGLIPLAGRNKDLQHPISNSCTIPHRSLNITTKGECFIDNCEMHLPFVICNVMDLHELDDVWNNPLALELQKDVEDKKFTWCAVEHCRIMDHDLHHIDKKGQEFYSIYVNVDESCNLSCPSCRTDMILHTQGDNYERQLEYAKKTIDLLKKFNSRAHITLTGNGDPLASNIMRPFVTNWVPKENHTITLFTNGLLMSKQLPDSKILPNISEFKISIDAGSKDVYEIVRRPGKFEKLIENLDWMHENKPAGADVHFRFVCQKANAHDVVNFVELTNKYDAQCSISRLDDWGTFDNFAEEDVVDQLDHPLRPEFLNQIRQVVDLPYVSIPYNITKYL